MGVKKVLKAISPLGMHKAMAKALGLKKKKNKGAAPEVIEGTRKMRTGGVVRASDKMVQNRSWANRG